MARPRIELFQDFIQSVVVANPNRFPTVVGPLFRFLDSENKAEANVGSYDRTIDNAYAYPQKLVTDQIELDKVEVVFDNAELQYFTKQKDSGNQEFRVVDGRLNRIKTVAASSANELIFKTTTNSAGTTFERSTEFDGRDVAVGDPVIVYNGSNTTSTKVLDLIPDTIDAVINAAVADTGNQATQALAIGSVTPGSGNTGDDTVAASGTYLGSLSDNIISDQYTIEVLVAGSDPVLGVVPDGGNAGDDTVVAGGIFNNTANDTYTVTVSTGGAAGVAQFTFTSLGGDDSTAPVTVSAFGTPIALGTKGLTVTFNDGGDTVLTVGDSFEVSAQISAGRLRVLSQSGTDDEISKVFPGFGTAFPVGANGAEITVTDGGDTVLTVGDTFVFSAQSAFDAVVATANTSGEYTGAVDQTYIIEVVQGGAFGSAEIQVTSSGTDSSGPTTITASATDAIVGNFGVNIQFSANTQGGLKQGDKFTIPVESQKEGAFKTIVLQDNLDSALIAADTASASIVAGTNTGDDTAVVNGTYEEEDSLLSERVSEIYTVTITTGGAPGVAEYTVVSASGTDNQAAASVSAFATDLAVGSRGLSINFTDGGDGLLTLNDSFVITVTKQNLSVDLHISKSDVSVPQIREDIPTQLAWQPAAEQVTVNSAIKLTDSTWKNGTEALPVISADVIIFYTALVPFTSQIQTARDQAAIDAIGANDPRANLTYAASVALQNQGPETLGVKVLGLRSNDDAGWDAALDLLKKDPEAYFLIPLTFDKDILKKFEDHADDMSSPQKLRWRRVLGSTLREETTTVASVYNNPLTNQAEDLLATVEDNPDVAGVSFDFVEINADQGVDLVTDGITAGNHIFRFLFNTDIAGNTVSQDFVIEEIISSRTMKISPALPSAVSVASKYEILKTNSRSDQVNAINAYANSVANRRFHHIQPDFLENENGVDVEGFHLAAGIAGLASVLPPQQGISLFELRGFNSSRLSLDFFSPEDLESMDDNGTLWVIQDVETDVPFIQHQVSTDTSSIEFEELSIGGNVDSVSFAVVNALTDFLGKFNITDNTLQQISVEFEAVVEGLRVVEDVRIGPQLISGTIITLERDPVIKDKVNLVVDLVVPAPLNNLEVRLQVQI